MLRGWCAASARVSGWCEMDRRMRPVKRGSRAKRVALALTVFLIGLCLAWPYRRTPRPEALSRGKAADPQLTLGDGVSLQLPGQAATVPLPMQPLTPRPADSEPDVAVAAQASAAAPPMSPSRPPALPDRYRPLFKPGADGVEGSGPVLPAAESLPSPARAPRRHTIHDGDTLESLAARYLGDAQRAGEILEANRSVLADAQLLPIGVTIVIPRPAGSATVEPPANEEPPRLVPLPTSGLGRGR
jgi:phage tail protein X